MIGIRLGSTAALVTGLAFATPAFAQEFDDSSIRGTWALSVEGFVAEGLINGAFDPGTPLFAIGRVIFDGGPSTTMAAATR